MSLGMLRSRFGGDRRVFDVADYGAVPGGPDSSASIQAALNQAHINGGGAVVFSVPGTYTVTGINRTSGSVHESLNAALLVYDNTEIVCAPGVTIQLGSTKDSARCYLLRNADPTNGNSNITIDGGFWDGHGIVAEATSTSGTTLTIPGDYASRLTSGTAFYISNTSGKTAFTCSIDSTYSSGTGLTTVTVASGSVSGGFQSSWQASNAQSPAIASITQATGTITITGDYTPYGSIGSSFFLYGNSDSASNRAYTITGISYSNPTTTITVAALDAGIGTVTKGNCAFIYNAVWYADLIRLQNVSNLTVRNTKSGGVDKYCWHVVACDRVLFENNTFDNGSDGIHLAGGNSNVCIRDTYGRTLDNLIAVVTDEKWYRPAQTDIAGDCSNILVDGVFLDAGKTCFEPFRATGTSAYTIDGLTCRSFYGTIGSGYGVRFADDTATGYGLLVGCVMRRILVQDINLIVPAGYSLVYIGAYGCKDVTCRDLHTNLATNQAVLVITPTNDTSTVNPEAVVVDGLTTGVATTTKLVQVDAIVDKLTCSNWNVKLGVSGVGIQASNTSATQGLIKDGNLTNSVFEAANGSGSSQVCLFLNTTAAMKSRVNFANVSMRQTNGSGTFNPIQSSGYAESSWNGVDITGTSGTCYIYPSAAGCVLRVDGANCKVDLDADGDYTDATNFIYGTSGSLSLNNPNIPVGFGASNGFAARGANPQIGDCFFNTSAWTVGSSQDCAGPGLYRYTGAYWQYDGPPITKILTTDTTLNAKHAGVTIVNTGAAASRTFTLPAATVGQKFTFVQTTTTVSGNTIVLDGNSAETIAKPSTGVQQATLTSGGLGSTVTIECVTAGQWNVVSYTGTWT